MYVGTSCGNLMSVELADVDIKYGSGVQNALLCNCKKTQGLFSK